MRETQKPSMQLSRKGAVLGRFEVNGKVYEYFSDHLSLLDPSSALLCTCCWNEGLILALGESVASIPGADTHDIAISELGSISSNPPCWLST